jgi:hypothetical protein
LAARRQTSFAGLDATASTNPHALRRPRGATPPICLQSFDDRIDHCPIKAFADQLSRQLSGDMIASRQHIKSSRARSPGVEGISSAAGQDVTLP